MNVRIRAVGQNLILLCAALTLTFGLAELLFRSFPELLPERARLKLYFRDLKGTITSERDPFIGFRYPPNSEARIHHPQVNVDFTYHTDEHGFRNPSPWPEHAEIVTVGDSQVFGYGVDDADSWASQVSRDLPRSHLINLGLIGAAPQQYVRVLERLGLGLRPRVVLFGLFPGNDARDAAMFNRWLNAGKPGSYDVWRFFDGNPPGMHSGVQRLIESSYFLQFLSARITGLSFPSQTTTMTFPDGSKLDLDPSRLAKAAARSRRKTDDFQRVMKMIQKTKKLAREHGFKLVVVLFPTKEEVYLPLVDQRAPRLVQPFLEALEKRDVSCLDLVPYLQQHRDVPLFIDVDGHPNVAGQTVIAEAVIDYLKRNAEEYGLHDWD